MPGPFHEDAPNLGQTLPGDMNTITGSGFDAVGVEGTSTRSNGVHGSSGSDAASGVYGDNTGGGYGIAGRSTQGIGVFGEGGTLAGRFIGDVEVTGDIRLVNADCAEDFDIAGGEPIPPGTVMVFHDDGALRPSERQYDTRVAGVVSGAGDFKPAIVLDRRSTDDHRLPIALLGKVYCMVDADHAPVQVGDLLTTSSTAGHAMKVSDPTQAFGAVLGKALRPFESGRGLIPILVTLQ